MVMRTVTAEYIAKVDRFISNTLKAKSAATGFGESLAGASKSSIAAWDDLGTKATVIGAGMTAALGLAGKAAVDWETSWAGVTKTVDGSASQMAELETGLRNLATELPATHAEIAAVAEAAGQLGVKRKDILGFTETMIAMGESTNLSAEEAATSLAQISNVMGTMEREGAVGVERLASTVVALGNAGASTEKDIVSMAARLTGAGKLAGATESDILALANAMSSVGIEAQLGGGVMSRVLQQINSQVISGGEDLEGFARIAGMSADEFSAKWKADPVAAVDSMVRGLGAITENGGDAVGALADVGIKGTENTSVLLRLSGASDILTDSLALGKTAWQDNTALMSEAEKRYATTASQIEIARNKAKNAAIDFGSVLAPAIVSASEAFSDAADTLADLPTGVQQVITYSAAGVAGLALLGGGAIKATTSVLSLKKTLDDANISAGRFGRTIGVAGVALAAAAVSTKAFDEAGSQIADWMGATATGVEQATARILEGEGATADFATSLDTATSAGAGFGSLLEKVSPVANLFGGGIDSAKESLTSYDTALAQLVASGNGDKAADFLSRAGVSAERAAEELPAYTNSLTAAGNQQSLAGGSARALKGDLESVGEASEKAKNKVDEYLESIVNAGLVVLSSRAAQRDLAAAIDDAAAAAQEATKAGLSQKQMFDINTEAGRKNQAALDGVADKAIRLAQTIYEETGSEEAFRASLASSRTSLEATARKFISSEKNVQAFVNGVLKVPPARTVKVTVAGWETAVSHANEVYRAIDRITGKTVYVNVVNRQLGTSGASIRGGQVKGAATGGYIRGPGTTTSDSIPALLSDKEYVVKAAAVMHYGVDLLHQINSMQLNKGALAAPATIQRFADGGQALTARSAMYNSRPAPVHVSMVAPVAHIDASALSAITQRLDGLQSDFRNIQFALNMDGQQVARVITTHQQRAVANGSSRRVQGW